MNLIIDQGNTAVKIFLFHKDKIIDSKKSNLEQNYKNFKFFVKKINIDKKENNVIYSSTSNYNEKIIKHLELHFSKFIVFDRNTKIPIKNLYKTPETLGFDRLAGIIGANYYFPNQNILSIDLGTAITYDFINKNNEYIGGNISPGMSMRFKALNHFTEKLPLLEKTGLDKKIGQNTNEAITLGVEKGIFFEINNYITDFQDSYEDVKIILTGGDCFFFEKRFNNIIFAKPYLVPVGLNRILNYNV